MLRLDSLLAIVVTRIGFTTLLVRLVDLNGLALGTNAALPIVSPVATLVVWALVRPRPRLSWRPEGWAFVCPVAWIAFTFVRGGHRLVPVPVHGCVRDQLVL